MTHEEKALQAFTNGANCAQAVVLAYADDLGMDEKIACRLASSFGGGIGRLREVCGAVSGMMMVYGLLRGYDDLNNPEAKKAHYQNVQALANRFREENGSIICRELLDLRKNEQNDPSPTPRASAAFHARPCFGFVQSAARILDRELNEN